jgi:hypothetical protein
MDIHKIPSAERALTDINEIRRWNRAKIFDFLRQLVRV